MPIFDPFSGLRIRLFEGVSKSLPGKRRQILLDELQHFFRQADANLPEQPARGRLQEPLLANHIAGAHFEDDRNEPRGFFAAFWRQLEYRIAPNQPKL